MEDDLIPVETSVIQQLESAAVVQQLDAAHKYPQHRSTKQRQEIIAELKSECTATREIAEECEYSLPRGKTSIKGPSVHLMRAVASRFGNIQKGARIIGIEDRVVRAQGVAWDLEMNVRMSVEVQRRITGKDGKRFNDDMINTTAMAALAIAE
ncbi:MAG TPA: hypothetical protein VFI71_03260, partial [Pyrinomonadaceae bacterium]|nr:hypothetical protein [Pyrinomonadaceae bacterium]